jgi:hypothetical protein
MEELDFPLRGSFTAVVELGRFWPIETIVGRAISQRCNTCQDFHYKVWGHSGREIEPDNGYGFDFASQAIEAMLIASCIVRYDNYWLPLWTAVRKNEKRNRHWTKHAKAKRAAL